MEKAQFFKAVRRIGERRERRNRGGVLRAGKWRRYRFVRVYSLRLYAGPKYPNQPPRVKFITKIKCDFVSNKNGEIITKKFSMLSSKYWKSSYNIETILKEIKRQLTSSSNRKQLQPSENEKWSKKF